MHLHTRNVNTAFREMVSLFHADGRCRRVDPGTNEELSTSVSIVKRPSRNGNVLMIDEPVTITYSHPRERVLFNTARDANPFFHLYEALWMLAGRNDVAPLAYYASKMREFSDDGRTLNGAYGYRWRKKTVVQQWVHGQIAHDHPQDWGAVDQLSILVNHLKADPTSRRTVLQMWNVEDDLLKIGPGNKSLDCCCNLSVMFSIRRTVKINGRGDHGQVEPGYLDMTVTNRSNDMIWGMLGANYVHFTILQEYMAARLGVEVGLYHHFTNNLHVYDWNWKPEEWLKDAHIYDYGFHIGAGAEPEYSYPAKQNRFTPLVKDQATFERELPKFVEWYSKDNHLPAYDWAEPFLNDVAQPMCQAFMAYKRRSATALSWTQRIVADDWRVAAQGWIERRLNKLGERKECVE